MLIRIFGKSWLVDYENSFAFIVCGRCMVEDLWHLVMCLNGVPFQKVVFTNVIWIDENMQIIICPTNLNKM